MVKRKQPIQGALPRGSTPEEVDYFRKTGRTVRSGSGRVRPKEWFNFRKSQFDFKPSPSKKVITQDFQKAGRQPAPMLSREQEALTDFFGGSPTWGSGKDLPKFDGVLVSGGGLIKNGDGGATGRMFGF